MPRYGCIGLTADERPFMGIQVCADDPVTAGQIARQLWQRVPEIEAVEVWRGRQRVYPQSDELKAAG